MTLDEFIEAEKTDHNLRWKMYHGDIHNLLDCAIDERDQLRADLERERMEFMAREHALCKEVERLRALCEARPNGVTFATEYGVDTEDEEMWIKKIDAAGRGEG